MITKPTYPNSLRSYRLKRGLKQTDVAKSLGLKWRELLGRWENGKAMPNFNNLIKLAEFYEVPLQELYRELRGVLKKEAQGKTLQEK